MKFGEIKKGSKKKVVDPNANLDDLLADIEGGDDEKKEKKKKNKKDKKNRGPAEDDFLSMSGAESSLVDGDGGESSVSLSEASASLSFASETGGCRPTHMLAGFRL